MTTPNQKPVVLVTGCTTGGIGYALCQQFAPHAQAVYATSRRLASMQGFPSGNIRVLELDVSSEESVEAAVKQVLREEGRVDLVVSNAGGMSLGPILDHSTEEMKASFDTNVFGMHRLARATVPGMIERRHGLFMIVSSITALIPGPWHGIYSAGKSALLNYGETLSLECAPFNVHVSVIIPGAVKSNISTNEAQRWSGLAAGSYWKPFEEAVRRRMTMSQTDGVSMPTEVFAQRVVRQALRRHVRQRVVDGGLVWIYWVLGWLPRSWALRAIWKLQG